MEFRARGSLPGHRPLPVWHTAKSPRGLATPRALVSCDNRAKVRPGYSTRMTFTTFDSPAACARQ
jgi:hypothetical protein